MAEWLGEGLQNLLQQFDSVHRPLFSYLYGKQSLGGRCFYTAQFFIGADGSFQYDQFRLRRRSHQFVQSQEIRKIFSDRVVRQF